MRSKFQALTAGVNEKSVFVLTSERKAIILTGNANMENCQFNNSCQHG